MVKLKDFIIQLQKIRKDLQDKEVFVIAENGLQVPPDIKFKKIDYANLSYSKDNVECIIIEGY